MTMDDIVDRIAFTLAEAAIASGVSTRTLQRAIADYSLPARYPTARPVILAEDLRAWLSASPSERAAR